MIYHFFDYLCRALMGMGMACMAATKQVLFPKV